MSPRIPAALAVLVLGACPEPPPPPEPTPAEPPVHEPVTEPTAEVPEQRDTLVVAMVSDIGNLMSVVSESATDSEIAAHLYFPTIDADFDCSLKKQPALATRWEWSPDGRVLSMWLRDDITFADGTPVTADDIAFTYELVGDPVVASPRVSYVERMEPDGRPKVIGPHHIEWHFVEAYDRDTQMAHTAGLPILPKHLLQDADRATLRGHDYARNPVGSGPWKLAKHEPGSRVVLEPNEAFTGPPEYRPKLESVVFRVLPDYGTRRLELENGGIDLMGGITVSDADRLRRDHPEIRLVRRGWRALEYVGWNLENPKFQDVRVRKALAMAADVDGLMERLLTSEAGEVYARRAVGSVTPALCGVHNDAITPLAHDPDRARALLAEAGWTDTDGNGLVDKDGVDFEFTLITNLGNKRRKDAATLLKSDLAEVGVMMHIEMQETNALFENTRLKNYEAALMAWSAGLFMDPAMLWHCDTDEQQYQFNFVSYCSERADELIDKGLRTPHPAESAPIWKELQEVIYDDQPYLFLYWMDEIVGVHQRFQGTTIDVQSMTNDLHEWYVPEDEVKYRHE